MTRCPEPALTTLIPLARERLCVTIFGGRTSVTFRTKWLPFTNDSPAPTPWHEWRCSGFGELEFDTMLTVLLATRNRASILRGALESFCHLETPPLGWK